MSSAPQQPHRIARTLGYDGSVPRFVLRVYEIFLASAQYLACAVPALLFTTLVGWQSTHLAVWLAAASLLPIWPGTHALLASMRQLVIRREYASHPIRRFWSAFADAVRSTGWWAVLASTGVLLIQYDIVISPSAGAVVAVVGITAIVTLTIALSSTRLARPARERAITQLSLAGAALFARPWILLAWLMISAVAAASTLIPVVGTSLALFAPGAAGLAIAIVNGTLGFDAHLVSRGAMSDRNTP